MKRFVALTLGVLLGLVPGSLQAQVYTPPATSPYYRPPVSPYTTLGGRGGNAISYYNIVRPQIATGTALLQLQQNQQAGAGGQTGDEMQGTGIDPTGGGQRFMSYSNYFMRLNTGQTGGTSQQQFSQTNRQNILTPGMRGSRRGP